MEEKAQDQQGQFVRNEDFESLYANQVNFESSVWDLKLIFGLLDQHKAAPFVEQHTAISIPWVQAKLGAYYLQIALAVYEAENGKIKIPVSVLPPLPPMPADATPRTQALYELIQNLHHKLVEDIAIVSP
jgi:hypothetical protein